MAAVAMEVRMEGQSEDDKGSMGAVVHLSCATVRL